MMEAHIAKPLICAETWNAKTNKPPSTMSICWNQKYTPENNKVWLCGRWKVHRVSGGVPLQAQQCQDAFCNSASRTFNSGASERGLLAESGLQEFPVIMMLQQVTANADKKLEPWLTWPQIWITSLIKTANELKSTKQRCHSGGPWSQWDEGISWNQAVPAEDQS